MDTATETCEMACMPPRIHVTGCPNASRPACPPSSVHDMIVTWTDSAGKLLVFPGDLVLIGETMQCVEAIAYDPPEDEAVRVGLEGWDLTHCVTASALVAVTRYDTGPDRWRALKDYLNDVIKATSVDAEVWEGNLVVAALEARADGHRSTLAKMRELEAGK